MNTQTTFEQINEATKLFINFIQNEKKIKEVKDKTYMYIIQKMNTNQTPAKPTTQPPHHLLENRIPPAPTTPLPVLPVPRVMYEGTFEEKYPMPKIVNDEDMEDFNHAITQGLNKNYGNDYNPEYISGVEVKEEVKEVKKVGEIDYSFDGIRKYFDDKYPSYYFQSYMETLDQAIYFYTTDARQWEIQGVFGEELEDFNNDTKPIMMEFLNMMDVKDYKLFEYYIKTIKKMETSQIEKMTKYELYRSCIMKNVNRDLTQKKAMKMKKAELQKLLLDTYFYIFTEKIDFYKEAQRGLDVYLYPDLQSCILPYL